MATKFTVEQMKVKIAGLLAKAEATDSVEEQKTFSEAAERLMLKLGIEAAELEATGKVGPQQAVHHTRDFKNIYAKPMMTFIHSVSLGYGGITIIEENIHGDLWRAHIVGIDADVVQFLELADSLALQVQSALKRWVKEHTDLRYHTANDKWLAKRSFLLGYGVEVKKRLYEMRKEEEATVSPGAALVLVDKSARVELFKEQEFPVLKNTRGNRAGNTDGYLSGRLAGRNANLSGGTALPSGRARLG